MYLKKEELEKARFEVYEQLEREQAKNDLLHKSIKEKEEKIIGQIQDIDKLKGENLELTEINIAQAENLKILRIEVAEANQQIQIANNEVRRL